jgi:hypothetical protein
MTTVRFKYGLTTLPSANDRNGGEVGAFNWAGVGNHTVTSDGAFPFTGLKAIKIVASAAGDFAANYAKLPAVNDATLVIGQPYEIAFWVKSVGGKNIQIKLNGVQSGNIATVAGVYTCVAFALTAVSANTDLQVVSANGGSGDTLYIDDITIMSYQDFSATIARGIDFPDETIPVGAMNDYTDGSSDTQFLGTWVRKMSITLKVFQDLASAKALLSWVNDNNRMIDYGVENSIAVNPETAEEFKSIWLNGAKVGRQYSFNLKEAIPRSAWPF